MPTFALASSMGSCVALQGLGRRQLVVSETGTRMRRRGSRPRGLLERLAHLWHNSVSSNPSGDRSRVHSRPSQECPVDHDAAERAVDALPGPVRRSVYFGIGSLSVVLGVIGIFVPLWPTTCFLLLSGWCFARSSRRAERWLHENRVFGRYLSDYRERGIISSRVRRTSVATLWVFIAASTLVFAGRPWVVALLLLVAGAVTLHLYSLPTQARVPTPD